MMQDTKRKLEAGWLPDSRNILQPPPTKKEISQWISDHELQIKKGIEASHRMKQKHNNH
jgi:arsenate reductase-like glutaredoxin family protein